MIRSGQPSPARIAAFARWLTLRRVRAHATLLAVCLWGVCAIDFATPGPFDHVGNLKFQDFLPVYVSGSLVAHHRALDLYDPGTAEHEIHAIVGDAARVRLTYIYGPQVALVFAPFASSSFPFAARIWSALSILIFFACIFAIWKCCPDLRRYGALTMLSAFAFPPFYHCFVRGQLAALWLACFTASFLALRADRVWLAGAMLGVLAAKPTFLLAIPLILLLARAWKMLSGLILSAAAQLAFTRWYFGSAVMHSYLELFRAPSRWIGLAELTFAPTIMHSLRSFWTLLVPLPSIALALYILTSIAVIAITTIIWRSSSPLALRFSALTLAAVLVNPHLFVYDLLVLVPALLLGVDWALASPRDSASPAIRACSYLIFPLVLIGPLSRWTHIQFSVVALVLMVWTIYQARAPRHKLAFTDSAVI